MTLPAIVPAAGLGTRLRPLTDHTCKEMLPLGGRPAIAAALAELADARVPRVAVVVSPGKDALRSYLGHWCPPGMEVTVVEQPEPHGVYDAIDRGRRALGAGRFVVVYPDYVHVPGQRGLAPLLEAAATVDASWFALYRRTPERARRCGQTARALAEPVGGRRHRFVGVAPGTLEPSGAFHTTFAEVHGLAWVDEVAQGPLDDSRLFDVLGVLSRRGQLYGLELEGDVLDLGVRAGYDHAVARFDDGSAAWGPGVAA